MAASVAAVANTVGSGSDTTLVVNLPSGIVSGSMVVLQVSGAAGPGSATATGWTVDTNSSGMTGASDQYVTVLYRICNGSEGSTVTVTFSQACFRQARSYRLTAHASSSPVDVSHRTAGTSSSANDAGVTVGTNDCLMLFMASNYSSTFSGSSPTSPLVLNSANANQALYTGVYNIGATGAVSVSITFDNWGVGLLLVKPSAGGGGGFTPALRKTLSLVGTRIGSRQVRGG